MKQKPKMKKSILHFFLVMFFACLLLPAGLTACSSDDEIFPLNDASGQENLITFFQKEHLEKGYDRGIPNGFFGDKKNNTCIVVSSREEFLHLYHGNHPLPEVDFSQKSLIIGQSKVEQGGYFVEKQVLVNKNNEYQLDLYIRLGEGYHDQWITLVRYWGIYPKLQKKDVTINLIRLK